MGDNAPMNLSCTARLALAACAWPCVAAAQLASGSVVYRCPGNVYTSNLELSVKQAEEKGCKVIEAQPVTVLQTPRSRVAAPASGPRPPEARVDPAEQRSRDSDARRILEAELRKDETQLTAMLKDYNNGEPERLGSERNYQRYLDRVAEMKAAIARKESDVAALKRELGKLPQ